MSSDGGGEHESHPLFLPVVFAGGLLFGVGLAVSQMARPEIVLEFLQFSDFGLVFVMGGAATVVGATVFLLTRAGRTAPLTNTPCLPRRKHFDGQVVAGGAIFGIGWGLSGICPGAAYASLGIGNWPILLGIAGMFVGAYVQGYARQFQTDDATPAAAD